MPRSSATSVTLSNCGDDNPSDPTFSTPMIVRSSGTGNGWTTSWVAEVKRRLYSTCTDVVPGAGTLNVAAVSLLSAAALDALQADPVLLASITFQALAPGSGNLLISDAELSDALAAGIALGAFAPVPISVAIPEPATWLPVAVGLVLLARRRRRER